MTSIVIKYLTKWLQVIEMEEDGDDSDDPERLTSKSDFADKIKQNGYF